MIFCLDGLETNIRKSIESMEKEFGFQVGENGEKLSLEKSDRFFVQRKDGKCVIQFVHDNEIFVGLRYLLQTEANFSVYPERRIENLSVMCDCSRNAVMSVESVKRFIRHLAIMGYNQLMLYTEDTYEVEGEPYFGYLRGKYTKAELKELDAYAKNYGVTLIPCIQTLAHLDGLKNWTAEYSRALDCENILLVGDERVYQLIENMLSACRECFSSELINIGMDEAWLLGAGNYLARNGFHERYEIMTQHLKRILELTEKYGFKPFMWSDMFFRVIAKDRTDPYNDEPIPPELYSQVPAGVNLIYWDYYHEEEADYARMIARHEGFGRELWFAGSSFTSYRFSADNERGLRTMIPALNVCAQKGVKTFCVTQWGDNGGDASMFSALRSLMKIASLNYGENENVYENALFVVSGGYTVSDFKALDFRNDRYLFYNDCFVGKYNTAVEKGYEKNYEVFAKKLEAVAKKKGKFQYLFVARQAYCEVMQLKYNLGNYTREAYAQGKSAINKAIKRYKILLRRVQKFYKAFKIQWMTDNKPVGFEIQDVRVGGLICRLSDCIERMKEYVAGKAQSIPELETELLDVFGNKQQIDWKMAGDVYCYKDMVSVNFI